MRAGLVLTQFFALFATTTAAILSLAGAEREFELPSCREEIGPIVARRCYTLAVVGDSALQARVRLPKRIRLTSDPDTASAKYHPGWYQVAVATSDTVTNRLGYYMHGPRWRAVSADSLDIALPGWPTGTRMRFSVHGESAEGRLVQQGDAFYVLPFNGSWHVVNWPAVWTVRATRTTCVGERAI